MEGLAHITQAEWHPQELPEANRGGNGGLVGVSWVNWDLMVFADAVNLSEHLEKPAVR